MQPTPPDVGCLVSFTIITIGMFVVLTVAAMLAGYQVKGEWPEKYGTLITAVVLLGTGIAVSVGL